MYYPKLGYFYYTELVYYCQEIFRDGNEKIKTITGKQGTKSITARLETRLKSEYRQPLRKRTERSGLSNVDYVCRLFRRVD